ncbi:hypothetical protein GNI_015860 [Gregarina niphandrodes]|uniref:Uncharacterized protein n=1 Tax=Gregarina niphandrodes TaxID=110365 RepID=A0A023BC81_GRENI|nr:hypothetical protein GNI_015860 [Gregarina niphandrodes]EZG82923.1 hypothetical protein GNI_015860 [Gregarina niphandrodes]|eukprot:XP_011128976.1 hypothetical protein GNI_015860 [Gregarina niphandrodes]
MHEDTESESVVSARAKKKKGLMKKLKFKIPFTKSSLSKKNSVLTMGSGSLPASPHSSVASPHTPVSANPKSSFPSSPQQPDASSFPTGSIASRAAAFGQPIKTSNLPNNKDLTGKEPQGRNATEGRNKAETHTSKGIQGHLKGILSSNKTHGHLKEDTGRSTDGHSKGETTKSKQEPATRISSHEPDESDETLVGYAPSVTQSIAKKHVDMVVQYEEELRELKSQLAPLERHNMEGDAQIEQLKALINEKEEYSARVHTDFLEAQRDLLRLQDENTQLQSALKQQELLLASFKPAEGLEAQLNEARSELEQLRLRPPHRHDLSECPDCYQLSENQRVAAARELEQQKELVQQKKQDYDALQSQVQNLRRECSQKQSQITRMAHDLDSLMSIQAEAKAPPVAKFSRGAQTEPTSKGTPKGSSPRGSGSRKGRILAELNDSYRKNPLTDELRLCLEHQETMKATKEAALQIAAAAQKLQALTGSKSPLPPDAAAYTTVGPKGPSNSNSPRGSTSADPVIATVPNAPAASPAAVSPAAVVTGRPVGSGHTHMAVEAQLFLPDSSLFEPTSHDRQWHYGSSSMLVNHTATQRGWSYRWANGRYVLERLVQ